MYNIVSILIGVESFKSLLKLVTFDFFEKTLRKRNLAKNEADDMRQSKHN